jgi:hypothetical protein
LKIILVVEGETERAALPGFIKRWLDPRLNKSVKVKAVKFSGSGGYLKEIRKVVKELFNAPDHEDIIAVIGLLDLYGLPNNFFPSRLSDAQARYDWAKQKLEGEVGESRFRQFFAVHELEAWLLSDPSIFPRGIREVFPASVRSPESVNFNEPPAQLLERLYQKKLGRPYRKIVDGSNLFSRLDPEIAYRKCPRLKEMLDEILRLAKASETDHADTQHSTRRASPPRTAARRPKDRPRPGR